MAKKRPNKSNPEAPGYQALERVEADLYEAAKQNWESLVDAEWAFKKSMEVAEQGLLVNALAAWEIAQYQLYKPAFDTLNAYLVESKHRLGVSRAYFFERVRIAEALKQYRDELYAAGFKNHRDVSKLRLFYQAIDQHGEEEAIKQLPLLSYRDYQRWVKGRNVTDDSEADIEIDTDGIRHNGEILVSMRKISRLLHAGETPYVVGVRSDAEKRALSRWLNERRKNESR